MSGEIILFGCKFLVAEIGSWVTRDKASKTTLNPIVRWGMNTTYVAVVVVSIFFVLYCYIGANTEYNKAKSILHGIVDDLHSKAPQFNPKTYSPLVMLKQLAPAKAMLSHIHQVARSTRHGIICYYAILILLNLLYIPLFIYSLRYIYTQSEFERKLCCALKDVEGESCEKLERKFFKSQNSRRAILLQAVAWFLATFSELAILTAQLCFRGDGFLKDAKWIRLTLVGLHLPPAILGNIKKKSSHADFNASTHYWIGRCKVPSSVGHFDKQGPETMRSRSSDEPLGKLGSEILTARSSHEPLDQRGLEVFRASNLLEPLNQLGSEVLRAHSTDGPPNTPEGSSHKEKLVGLVDIYTDLQPQESHQTQCVDGTTTGTSKNTHGNSSYQSMATQSPHQGTFSCNE
ncbi:uncharacterized protein MELLADRAFT_88827 [Melampsora larici-populina 98AG31]|uniref:Uncharacterized protein n=1 Tax=Melampsora larici-populina (strain 98AG31 / pathotype 3-4-7) TaxID=747676 RepID=F4RT41_MELLP|nr:uncharacterized protein MELLADRAFT_88827 [Melampsora larici-populina 98AG31]EGG04439.1 hypothetical protein MELLADRAFT_88827 [Melampsora larici-populina 98AG31]